MTRRKTHLELQSLLDGFVSSRANIEPPVESRQQVLPLGKLAWEDFERLCARLIHSESAVYECYRYGKQGEDQSGIDILARRWVDGRIERWTYQCKRHTRFTASEVDAAIKKLRFETEHFVILISSEANTSLRDAASHKPNAQIWDAEDISRRLKDLPRLVEDFFGITWRRAFCGNTAASLPDNSQLAIRRLIGLDFGHQEWLHSNLLRVTKLPEKVYGAPVPLIPSSATTPEELAAVPPVKITKTQAWTLARITDDRLAALVGCNPKKVETKIVAKWVAWPQNRGRLRDLLYEHIRQKFASLGLAYDGIHKRFYFIPDNGQERVIEYRSYKRNAIRKVAYPYHDKESGEVRFWVHHAVRLFFVDVDQEFFLQVEPGYAFTKDGIEFLDSEDIGPLATRRKSGERNRNVFGHLVFWCETLSEGQGNISIECAGQQTTVSKMYESGKAAFGIPSDSTEFEEIASTVDELDLEALTESHDEEEID